MVNDKKNFTSKAWDIIKAFRPLIKSSRQKEIESICHRLHVTNDQANVVKQRMLMAVKQGLSKMTHARSSVKCFPTYVRHLPSGEEKGRYLALDLGGTNFRVYLIEMSGEKNADPRVEKQKFRVPKKVKIGTAEQLFDFMARSIHEFISEEGLAQEELDAGFTFSFPVQQQSIKSGILSQWTKGYTCSGAEGRDVCEMLQEAVDRHGDLRINVVALLNDSTACLLSCALRDSRCRVGLIVGTGCNACYLEDLHNVGTWVKTEEDEEDEDCSGSMVINTEWGAFGERGELDFLLTKWDRIVDRESLNPGKQTYEKLMSGMYLGEVVRHILVELADRKLVFRKVAWEALREKGAFQTKHICDVEYDPVGEFARCRKAMAEVLGSHAGPIEESDGFTIRYVCEEVSRRASMLLGAGIACLLRKMNYKDVVVAVDGTLFREHPLFYNIVKKKITQLMGTGYQFDLIMKDDGSGVGAAVTAAVRARVDDEEEEEEEE